MREFTPLKLIFYIFIISIIFGVVISFYGGSFKDAVTKATCPLRGEEYISGNKKGDGNCIMPVSIFE